MQELLKSGNEKLMELLTEEQKTQWKEMLGQPVDPGVISGGL